MYTDKQLTRWQTRAYKRWVEDGGKLTLRQAVHATAPRRATHEDEIKCTARLIATQRVIYDAIMEAI